MFSNDQVFCVSSGFFSRSHCESNQVRAGNRSARNFRLNSEKNTPTAFINQMQKLSTLTEWKSIKTQQRRQELTHTHTRVNNNE